ncbi:MAG: ATP-binding protein [Allosphingosinicella sp.]
MAAPDYVPASYADKPRSSLPIPPPAAWMATRPADLRKGQPYGPTLGRPGPDRRLAGCAESVAPPALPVAGWPVAQTAAAVGRLIDMKRAVRILVAAPGGSGRLHFAAAVAELLGTRLLRIGGDAPEDEPDLYMRAQRLALITGHALYWDRPPRSWSPQVASTPVQFVAVAAPSATPASGLVDLAVSLPPLSAAEKRAVWNACGPGLPEIDGEAADRALAGARLGDLLAAAEHRPADCGEACLRIRASARARLEQDAQLLDQPYDWGDLVLPARQRALIETLLGEMRARDRLLAQGDRRAKYGGLGQSILFHGPPGTGKTMAAQVLARTLQVDLVRVDCASVISKFIGETAKNLRAIFSHVQGTGALLLFDEADALFARRTETKDALDRHANADTNYLLQLIEGFDGAAILTTNKKENIDPAFIRRIRHMVDFGAPGTAERRLLWRRHIETLSDAVPEEPALAAWCERLASLDLSPAQIKGAALSAAFSRDADGRAAPELEDLLVGIERELAKDGRALDHKVRAELASCG